MSTYHIGSIPNQWLPTIQSAALPQAPSYRPNSLVPSGRHNEGHTAVIGLRQLQGILWASCNWPSDWHLPSLLAVEAAPIIALECIGGGGGGGVTTPLAVIALEHCLHLTLDVY